MIDKINTHNKMDFYTIFKNQCINLSDYLISTVTFLRKNKKCVYQANAETNIDLVIFVIDTDLLLRIFYQLYLFAKPHFLFMHDWHCNGIIVVHSR